MPVAPGEAGRAGTMGSMDAELFARTGAETTPGAVHVPDWPAPGRRRELRRDWARPPAGLRVPAAAP